jgi:hypothetical protein
MGEGFGERRHTGPRSFKTAAATVKNPPLTVPACPVGSGLNKANPA